MLIIISEDFYRDPAAVCARVFRFLGLSDHQAGDFARFNAQSEKPLAADTRVRLEDYFRPHNLALARFLGHELPW